MKKQRVKPGDVLSIELGKDQFAFARVFDDVIAVYDKIKNSSNLPKDLGKDVMFVVSVYTKDLSSGRWPRVGRDEQVMQPPNFCKIDPLNNEFSIYELATGKETPSTEKQCFGMEQLAVWHSEMVEDRIRSTLQGEKSDWLGDLGWIPQLLRCDESGNLKPIIGKPNA